MGVGHRIVNVKLERVPLVAFSQIEGENEKGFVIWMSLLTETVVPFLQGADKPSAQVIVRFLFQLLPKSVVYRFPNDHFSHGGLRRFRPLFQIFFYPRLIRPCSFPSPRGQWILV